MINFHQPISSANFANISTQNNRFTTYAPVIISTVKIVLYNTSIIKLELCNKLDVRINFVNKK
jgi:hypothetical protein